MTTCTCRSCRGTAKPRRRGTQTVAADKPRLRVTEAVTELKALEERDRQDYAAAKSGGTVPTRERADQLARELPADRRGWDGSPLSDKDRRFYALREAGYTGPINGDGYPETTGQGADALRYMAEQRGETPDW